MVQASATGRVQRQRRMRSCRDTRPSCMAIDYHTTSIAWSLPYVCVASCVVPIEWDLRRRCGGSSGAHPGPTTARTRLEGPHLKPKTAQLRQTCCQLCVATRMVVASSITMGWMRICIQADYYG